MVVLAAPCEAVFHFDADLADSSGNGHDGRMIAAGGTPATPQFAAGRSGRALRLPAIIGIHLVKLGDRPTLKNGTSQGMQTKLLRLPDPEQVAQQSAVIKVQFGGRINQRLFCQPCLSSDAVPVAILTAFGAQGFELDAVLPAWGTGPILA